MAVTFETGLIAAWDPPAAASDKRYTGGSYTAYTTVADASASNGFVHQLSGSAAQQAWLWLPRINSDTGENVILLDVGDEVRMWVEFDPDVVDTGGTLGPTDYCISLAGVGAGLISMSMINNAGTVQYALVYEDSLGANHVGTTLNYGALNFADIELLVRKTDTDSVYCEMRRDGSTVDSFDYTAAGDIDVGITYVAFNIPGANSKFGFHTYQFGRVIITGNVGGSPADDDEQWPLDWNPTLLRQYPTSDVTSPDEWTGTGSATLLYSNVDDADGSYSAADYNGIIAATDGDLLLGWPTVSGSTSGTIWGVQVVAEISNRNGSVSASSGGFIADNGTESALADGTFDIGTVVRTYSGLWQLDPSSAAWTESGVDNTDFGLQHPTHAEEGTCSAMWRYVIYGGTALPSTGSLVAQKRRSMKAMLVR